jgi:hypothetical protein
MTHSRHGLFSSVGDSMEAHNAMIVSRSLFVAFAALYRSFTHGFMAAFTGLMRPFLAKPGDLSSLLLFMACDTPFFKLDSLMFCMGKVYVTVLGGETDHVSGQGCSGSKHNNGDAEDEMLHLLASWGKYNPGQTIIQEHLLSSRSGGLSNGGIAGGPTELFAGFTRARG